MDQEELGRRRGNAVVGWGSVGLYVGILGTALDLFDAGFEAWFATTMILFLVFAAGSAFFVWRFDRVREIGRKLQVVATILLLLFCAGILVGIVVKGVG